MTNEIDRRTEAEFDALIEENRRLTRRLWVAEQRYAAVEGSVFMKAARLSRDFPERAKRLLRRFDFLYLALKTVNWCFKFGTGNLGLFLRGYRAERARVRDVLRRPGPRQRAAQREATFERAVRISLLLPVMNADAQALQITVESVLAQTRADWQLCIADTSGLSGRYSDADPRIRCIESGGDPGPAGLKNACIALADGDWLAVLNPGEALQPAALYGIMREIDRQDADFVYTDADIYTRDPRDAHSPEYKPDYFPDNLRSCDYIGFCAFSRALMDRAGGGFRAEYDGAEGYELTLRLTEQARRVAHVPSVLHYRRSDAPAHEDGAAVRALEAHMARAGLRGTAEPTAIPGVYRARYALASQPLISIIIPNKDHLDDLAPCVDAIRRKTRYPHWEIVIVENNSADAATFEYYAGLEADPRIRVVRYEGAFNYSAVNNLGTRHAKGEYLVLLNNDTEVITPEWLNEMLMFAQRPDVGAVGAKLYYPDDTVQHAGVILGVGGVAGQMFRHLPRENPGYMNRAAIAQDFTVVTAACMMIPRRVWDAVGGLDEGYAVAFNDVDLCMRIRKAGYLIAWTPWASLYHYEYKSRGAEDTPEKRRRYLSEILRFKQTWEDEINAGDPCYNPNLSPVREDFSSRYE